MGSKDLPCHPHWANWHPLKLRAFHSVLSDVTRIQHIYILWTRITVKTHQPLLLRNKSIYIFKKIARQATIKYLRLVVKFHYCFIHIWTFTVSLHIQTKWTYLNREVHSFFKLDIHSIHIQLFKFNKNLYDDRFLHSDWNIN
jgi:hypothetical protein